MSREITRGREAMMTRTLPADARVANFLREWIQSMELPGLRTDQIRLPISRAEIGSYLGLTLETVSRTLAKLEQRNVIRIVPNGVLLTGLEQTTLVTGRTV